MPKIFKDELLGMREILIDKKIGVFQSIINQEKYGFYLIHISDEKLEELRLKFEKNRYSCLEMYNNSNQMGACNMSDHLYNPKEFRYYGIKISNPELKILGTFHFRNEGIIYSPNIERVFEERDYGKFGSQNYYTTMSMFEIICDEANRQNNYFVHTKDDYHMKIAQVIKNGNRHILEKINKDELIEYASNPDKGMALQKRFLDSFIR